MLLEYLSSNFMTLMIISALALIMVVNRKVRIPATNLFAIGIVLLLTITVAETWKESSPLSQTVTMQTFLSTVVYILRPFIIMLEVIIMLPDKRFRPFCLIPAVINAVIYSTALFGSGLAFRIKNDLHWVGGPLHYSIYISQIFYVALLFLFSAIYFKRQKTNLSIIVFGIFVQSVIAAVIENTNFLPGFANPITALCMLEFYIYLSMVYQQQMRNTIAQYKLDIAKNELLVLRNQIQPHFIYGTLNIIRSLAKRDSKMAVECINSFSKYLRSHIGAIKSDELIPFEEELENAKIYLSLVQIDYMDKAEILYELATTDFMIPPLTLEPLVENAVDHGISHNGGTITIATVETESDVVVRVSDDGTASEEEEEYTPVRNGIGLKNTRKRLELQCGGTLSLNITDSGTTAEITLPKEVCKRK